MAYYFGRQQYPLELEEIAEMMVDGHPAITLDDILDMHVFLCSYNARVVYEQKSGKKCRRAPRK